VGFFKHSLLQGKTFIQPAFNTELISDYKPQTGDIFVVHYLGHGMIGIPVAEHWPTHAAFVWVKPNQEAFVIECTKFIAPTLPNILLETRKKKRGVRMVPLIEYINAVDNVLYVRRVIKGNIESDLVEKVVREWAVHMDFETRIADSMTFDLTVAIGFAPVWPKLSAWCTKAAKLDKIKQRKNQAFCSEFVSLLLQKLGAVDDDFKAHYSISPAGLLKTAGQLENISKNSARKIVWGDDGMIIRRL